MIQIYDIPENFDVASELQNVLPCLPPWRLYKTLSYRQDIDRFLCAKSFLMLEGLLRAAFSLDYCPEFSFGSHGKPYFQDRPDIFFNISHCRRGIACAVLDKPVGIDIEEIQYDGNLAPLILNSEEIAAVGSAEEPDVNFTELWTLKESFLKLTGEGIRDNMKDVLSDAYEVSFTTEINRSAAYVYTVAEKKPLPSK